MQLFNSTKGGLLVVNSVMGSLEFLQNQNQNKFSFSFLDKIQIIKLTKVLYMSSSFWLLRVESRDFSQAEKDSTARKDEQTNKMTTIFTQSGARLSF